jgi:DNA processing protein
MNVGKAHLDARAGGVSTVAIDDEHYPPLLREIHDPPALLYVLGDPALLLTPQLAVVGSRGATSAGLRLARDLSGQLSAAGLLVGSGLALGIDTAAHEGALQVGGRTVAVMATGIEQVYPHRNRALARRIEATGCLVSEFPPGTPPRRHHFPKRNRIISGMALGVVVIEAALPSGSLITAGAALEQGREVFALPWSPLHEGGLGCLQLLRDGAKMVRAVDDILEEFDVGDVPRGVSFQTAREKGREESWLLPLLGYEAITLDELVTGTARPAAHLLAELSNLELAGRVQRLSSGYIRC